MKLTDPLKSALSTALWTFLAAVGVLSTGWLQQVAKWASTSGHAPLPGLSTIGYAVIGAIPASAAGLVAFVIRFAQSKNVIPGNAPAFGTTETTVTGPGIPAPSDLVAGVQKLRTDWNAVQAAALETTPPLPAPTPELPVQPG